MQVSIDFLYSLYSYTHYIRKASKGTFWLWWNPSLSLFLAWIPLEWNIADFRLFSPHGWVKAHEKRKHKPFDAWKQKQMCSSEKAFIKMTTLKHIHLSCNKRFFSIQWRKTRVREILWKICNSFHFAIIHTYLQYYSMK